MYDVMIADNSSTQTDNFAVDKGGAMKTYQHSERGHPPTMPEYHMVVACS